MQKNRLNILSTRPLNESIINQAAEQDVIIDCISFIETKPIESFELKEKIRKHLHQKITAVFTSMNAVDAVKEHLGYTPEWNIFSIGQTTKNLIEESFGKQNLKATADNASDLADIIIKRKIKEVVFFCGDQRRDELPTQLKNQDINVEEVVVYKTNFTPKQIEKTYDGILFFSPSAVDSFFSVNTVDGKVVVFAIGDTTAQAIKEKTNNKIIIAKQPGKEALVKEMLMYFSEQKQLK